MANFRVYSASEENAFEMERVDFETKKDAMQYLLGLSAERGIEIENDCIDGIDEEGFEFYACVSSAEKFSHYEGVLHEMRENYIEENF
jgi:hypothetical protein